MKIARDIGFEKEKEVVAYLKRLKYKILDTNFKTHFGEIDIIAKQDDTIVFIEVKYRKSSFSGTPQESVTYSKQQKIIKSSIVYLKQNNIKNNIRFDIVSVLDKDIELIKSAFLFLKDCITSNLFYFFIWLNRYSNSTVFLSVLRCYVFIVSCIIYFFSEEPKRYNNLPKYCNIYTCSTEKKYC
jgi:putative endonuclease